MKNIIHTLDSIFKTGFIHSIIAIITAGIILFIVNKMITKILKRHVKENLKVVLRVKKIMVYTIFIAIILLQIEALQSLATALLAGGGIFAVVIGLASQEAASSMINGCMIFAYKPYSIGDTICVPSQKVQGKVMDITLRHTVMETAEKTQLLIPNAIMNQTLIENISNIPNKKANYLYIDISYESDMDLAISIIQKTSARHPQCIDVRNQEEIAANKPIVCVHCLEFKDSGISLRATIYSKDSSSGFELLSDLRKSIKKEFDTEGIVIPYPHMHIIKESE